MKLIIEESVEKEVNFSDLNFKSILDKKVDSLKFLNEERGDFNIDEANRDN